ncbi:MAG: hypothetical protein KDE27_20060 [Planctomycetes bacterium]|nr:hypothetical protein [Planctomycetota bacterium]
MKHLSLALLVGAFGSLALAQTPDHLVGLTRNIPALRHTDFQNCAPLNVCPVPMAPTGAAPLSAGGTGWNPIKSAAWVTNGIDVALIDDNCAVVCPPMPIPGFGPNRWATGLEFVESLNQILIIDQLGFLHSFADGCPINPLAVCNTGLAPMGAASTSGIAVDEGNRYVFISYSDFATGLNRIAVSQLNNPCQILCTLQVPTACPTVPFGAITGLACDWGRQVLYATDGNSTIAMRYQIGAVCVQIVAVNCCTLAAAADPYVGIAVRPGRATTSGQPCANGTCPNCPMQHSLANDPNLGNAAFALDLTGAPAGSLAWCIIGAGPCTMPGVVVAPLCGPIFAQPTLGVLGVNPTGGAGGCSGGTSFAFPLPPLPGLAGWTISSQCIAICTGSAGIGTAVSNCLSFTLQGS